jgi:phage I-like protein
MLAQATESLPRFISTLAAPVAPGDEWVRVPLAVSGRWVRGAREFSITRQDLESIVRNFGGRQNGEINVDYDHSSEMPEVAAGGPIPSAGRIVKMDPPELLPISEGGVRDAPPQSANPSPDPRWILYGWYEPTDRARRLIANREYRYISPAIDWSARSKRSGKPQGATLSTVALTNRPFLEEMPPIRLSDPEYKLINEAAEGIALPREAHALSCLASNVTGGDMKKAQLSVVDGKVKITHEGLEFFADPEDVKACAEGLGWAARPSNDRATITASEATPATAQAESADVKTRHRAGAFHSEAEAAGQSISAVEIFRGEVDRALDDAVRTGKILPRRRDDWRKIALADFPTFRRLLSDQKPLVPLRPVGFSGTAPEGAQMQVKLLADQRMRERGISFGQALSEISREQPELAREYRRAVSSSE